MGAGFERLSRSIVSCERCPRLREYADFVAGNKPKRFAGEDFWAKPVPGFGDPGARLLVIGLAPARTGALRTGRIFTGDASARFLVRALHSVGFASQPASERRGDGLTYADCYVTTVLRCAPPGDRPLPGEVRNCSPYLDSEIGLLRHLESVLALGGLAFRAYLDHMDRRGVHLGALKFTHGGVHRFEGGPTLYASYHPSPRNTNTGLLTQGMLVNVLRRIRSEWSPLKHN